MEEKSNVVEEKRRYTRVPSLVPLQYRSLKNLKEGSTGTLTHDIGEGGVRFKSNEFISLACRLLLEINLPLGDKPIKAISKVAWIRKSPEQKEYEIGNQFLEISKEDRERIMQFVNKLLNVSL